MEQSELSKQLSKKLGRIKGYPNKKTLFYDLNPVMSDLDLFWQIVSFLKYSALLLAQITTENDKVKIAGIESRGFIWGAAVAGQLESAFIPIRKKGKIPDSTVREMTHVHNEYADTDLVLPKDCVRRGDSIVLIDDVLATGQTALGAINLLSWAGARVHGVAFVLRIEKLAGENSFPDIHYTRLLDV